MINLVFLFCFSRRSCRGGSLRWCRRWERHGANYKGFALRSTPISSAPEGKCFLNQCHRDVASIWQIGYSEIAGRPSLFLESPEIEQRNSLSFRIKRLALDEANASAGSICNPLSADNEVVSARHLVGFEKQLNI